MASFVQVAVVSQMPVTINWTASSASPSSGSAAVNRYDSSLFGGYIRDDDTYLRIVVATDADTGGITAPQIAGYDFAGWYTYAGSKARGEPALLSDATILLTQSYLIGYPSISGAGKLTFTGGEFCMIYAKWTAQEYLVILDPNGGSVTSGVNSFVRVEYAATYGSLPTPTRAGYTFAGWYTAASGGTRVTASTTVTKTDDHILYAHWTQDAITITVSFDAAGGTVSPASKTATSGATYGTLPTPTRAGYGFNGWWTEVTGGTQVTSATIAGADDITLHAQWIVNGVAVTFNGNGGTPSESSKTYLQGMIYGALPTATRAGYAFAGWWTAATGGTRVLPSSTAAAGTLYAHWDERQSVTGLF